MTTEIAFKIMLSQRGVHRALDVRRGTVGKWRHRYKVNPKSISLEKKIELLQRAGWKMYQQPKWIKTNNANTATPDIDYLNDFPGLTLLGKIAGMPDEIIRRANKKVIEHPEMFQKIYKKMA